MAIIVVSQASSISRIISALETHAALTQAIAALGSVLIATIALYFAVKSLFALQRQTEASVAMMTETFRPIVEVLGGKLSQVSEINFINKGNGAALNFRWRENTLPERWMVYTTNVFAPQEHGTLSGEIDWKKGLVLGYNSVAHREEILTHVQFGSTGAVFNRHEFRQRNAATRPGWTLHDPNLAIPAWHPDLIRSLPLYARLVHWWRLRRGKERRS